MIITRYDLITILIQELFLTDADRPYIASFTDAELITIYGKPQFKCIRTGYYLL